MKEKEMRWEKSFLLAKPFYQRVAGKNDCLLVGALESIEQLFVSLAESLQGQ